MEDDRIITLRFKEKNALDRELYKRLETEKEQLGLSMPACVKSIISEHFEDGKQEKRGDDVRILKDEMDGYLQQIQDIVRDELTSLSAILAGTLVRMAGISADDIKENIYAEQSDDKENNLPEYSDELPEGLEDVLNQLI